MGDPAEFDDGARARHGAAQPLRQAAHQVQVGRVPAAAAGRHEDARLLDLLPKFRRRELLHHLGADRRFRQVDRKVLDGERSALVRLGRAENVRPHGGALGPGIGGDNARHDVAAEGRPCLNELALLVDGKPRAVGGEAQAQPGRHPGGKVAAVGGGTEKQHRRLLLGHHRRQGRRETIGGIAAEEFVAATDHPVCPLVAEPFQSGQAVVAQNHRKQGLPQTFGQPAAVGEQLVDDFAWNQLLLTVLALDPDENPLVASEFLRRSLAALDGKGGLRADAHAGPAQGAALVHRDLLRAGRNRAEGARFLTEAAEIADVMNYFQHVSTQLRACELIHTLPPSGMP